MNTLQLLSGLVLLCLGAEFLVRGSTSIGLRLGWLPLVVGLTIVAFGTSTPELFVSVQSSLQGNGDLAVANVIGSNIFNVAIILGLSALIIPLNVHLQIIRLEAPLVIGASVLIIVLLLDGQLTRCEGILLLILMVTCIYYTLRMMRADPPADIAATLPTALPNRCGWGVDIVMVVGGLLLLAAGSHLAVSGATGIARSWGVSDALIGLTIVAAGTSLPELASSLAAAFKRNADIAIGNVMGSNLFNILFILGSASVSRPILADDINRLDYFFLVVTAIIIYPLMRSGLRLQRLEGAGLVAIFLLYIFLRWPGGGTP